VIHYSFLTIPSRCSDAASAKAARLYGPLLIGVNALYFALRYYWTQSLFWKDDNVISNVESVFVWLVLLGLQLYSYYGILHHAATHAAQPHDATLQGGSYLDLLALALVVQFGALLISSKFYYLLGVVAPLWGANNLRNTAALFAPPPSDSGAFTAKSAAAPPSAYHQQLGAKVTRKKKM
jgi:hypothetical protein